MITGLLIAAISISLSLVTAIAVWVNNTHKKADVIYVITSLSYIALALFNYLSTIFTGYEKLWMARLVMAFTVTSVAMTYYLLQLLSGRDLVRKKQHYRTRVINYILIPLTAVAFLTSFTPLIIRDVTNAGVIKFGIGILLFIVQLGLLSVSIVGMLLRNIFAKSNNEHLRSQSTYLLMGFVPVVFVAPLTGIYLPAVHNDFRFISLTPLYSAMFVVMVGYAMIRHKLFDIRSFVARTLAYIFTTIILAIIYIAPIVFGISLILEIPFVWNKFIAAVFIVVITATLYQKLKQWFDRVSNRIFFRDAYNATQDLSDLNKILAVSLDIEQMVSSCLKIVESSIRPEFFFMLLKPPTGDQYRLFSSTNKDIDNIALKQLSNSLDKTRNDILIVDMPEEESRHLVQQMREMNIAVVARFTMGKKQKNSYSLGYMVIGNRRSGKKFDVSDKQYIASIVGTLDIAMQNAMRYEEIKQFNETLQEKIEDATRKLRLTNDKLKKMDETKDEFISMASHQLRTPLTSVKGYVSMVLDGDVGPISHQQRELLNQSFQSSQRMANLISDLLNLSRINTGKFVIENSPVYLPAIIETELQQLREMAQAKGINLKLTVPPTFPTLMLDDGKIHQAVMNLIDNALYYTPSGGDVEVQLIETPTAIEFRVVDTGIGVPRDAQRHMFSKMFRAENARRARPDGTGLGLFMVKKVVVEQKGFIIFETEENKGSTFGFRFNKKDHQLPDATAPAPAQLPA